MKRQRAKTMPQNMISDVQYHRRSMPDTGGFG